MSQMGAVMNRSSLRNLEVEAAIGRLRPEIQKICKDLAIECFGIRHLMSVTFTEPQMSESYLKMS